MGFIKVILLVCAGIYYYRLWCRYRRQNVRKNQGINTQL